MPLWCAILGTAKLAKHNLAPPILMLASMNCEGGFSLDNREHCA